MPNNTLKLECLVEALSNFMNAQTAEAKARDAYTGYSWGYHGYSFIKEREEAATEFGNRLNGYIDARISERLRERNDPTVLGEG